MFAFTTADYLDWPERIKRKVRFGPLLTATASPLPSIPFGRKIPFAVIERLGIDDASWSVVHVRS